MISVVETVRALCELGGDLVVKLCRPLQGQPALVLFMFDIVPEDPLRVSELEKLEDETASPFASGSLAVMSFVVALLEDFPIRCQFAFR
jgi:hypothetical protein